MWEKLWDWAKTEVSEVRKAPVAILILLATGFGGGWYLAAAYFDNFYQERIRVLELLARPPQADAATKPGDSALPSEVSSSGGKPAAEPADTASPLPKASEAAPPPTQRPAPPVPAIVSAPSGIAIGGGTVHNPTVNNFAPPPWLLSAEQKAALAAQLRGLQRPPGRELIRSSWGDSESSRLAQQFVEVFRTAGWELEGSGFGQAAWTIPKDGLEGHVHSKESVPPALMVVAKFLRGTGFQGPMPLVVVPEVPEGSFMLAIGRRPAKF